MDGSKEWSAADLDTDAEGLTVVAVLANIHLAILIAVQHGVVKLDVGAKTLVGGQLTCNMFEDRWKGSMHLYLMPAVLELEAGMCGKGCTSDVSKSEVSTGLGKLTHLQCFDSAGFLAHTL